jgi:lipopolysaccharide transport system ATP-binding protein
VPVGRDAGGDFVATIEFAAIDLLPGSYNIRAHAMDTEAVRLFDTEERGLSIRGKTREFGMVRLRHRWVDEREESID